MSETRLLEEDTTGAIIRAFYAVYNWFGPGLLESLYSRALEIELTFAGRHVAREQRFSVMYRGHELGSQRIDLVIDGRVIVEVKAAHELHPHATRQLRTYLRISERNVGLLLHFGPEAKFYRLVNTLQREQTDP